MLERYNASDVDWATLMAAWTLAAGSALGSIFFSHVMEFAPCILCWYQRIFLFPLVLVIGAGLFPFDPKAVKFALPLAVAGWATAFYHNLLYSRIIPQELQPCSQGVSCTEKYIELLGFISIPMLSLISFTLIIVLLIVLKKRIRIK